MIKLGLISALMLQSAIAAPYVDIYESKDPKNMVIEITIDGCLTTFKVPKSEFASFSSNDKAMNEMVKLANEHAKSGCR